MAPAEPASAAPSDEEEEEEEGDSTSQDVHRLWGLRHFAALPAGRQ